MRPRRRRFVNTERWSTCLTTILRLVLAGRLQRVIWRRSRIFPGFHVMGVTLRGNMVHYLAWEGSWRVLLFWRKGTLEVIRRPRGRRSW